MIGIASDLVKCESQYRNIIQNQLGNVIVAHSIDDANNISRQVNYRYKIELSVVDTVLMFQHRTRLIL